MPIRLLSQQAGHALETRSAMGRFPHAAVQGEAKEGPEMVEVVKDTVNDRLRYTPVFTFALVGVEQNWRFFYLLARSPKPPHDAIVDALKAVPPGWGWIACIFAFAVSVALPAANTTATNSFSRAV
jgi:hypothetical protein